MSVADLPGGVSIGVDVGGTKVLGVALGRDGTLLAERRVPTPRPPRTVAHEPEPGAASGHHVAAAVAEVVNVLRRRLDHEAAAAPVGVGVPGMVDRGGVLRTAPNLPGAVGADLSSLLVDLLPGGVAVVDNDANLAGLAEHALGAARGADDALVITLGTGIGGALIVGGRVQRGAHGFAGEVGHMLVEPGGILCSCGRRGCWEQYASGTGLARMARAAAVVGGSGTEAPAAGRRGVVRGEHVTASARAGHVGAREVVDRVAWWVALGLANLVAVFDPSLVVLGGGMADAGELVLEPVRRAFRSLVYGGDSRDEVPIVGAALGGHAGAIGAALAARGMR